MTTPNELAHSATTLDWGTDAQIDAQNDFFALIEELVDATTFADIESYAHGATTDEMVSYALRRLA